jgi:uncharacterized membrane protein
MDPTLHEWLNLLIRWVHVFAGILWIGATYHFSWLDRQLNLAASSAPPGSPGLVWMVHSGGFYLVEKQKVPKLMPSKLHWFKWEAATTWLSGFLLLVVVYYVGGGILVDDTISRITVNQAIALGLALLVVGWFAYDALWLSPLGKNEVAGAAVCYCLLVAVAYGLTHLYSGRAAYLHVGALMGTLMAANVWVRILPAQRQLVAALNAGKEPDLSLGERAKQRSKHNTFMIVPVVFIMISNHFPATYGSDWSWAILGVLVLAGWAAAKIMREH